MSNKYVELRFTFKKYTDEGEDTEQEISFEGFNGWQRMQFHKVPPTEVQLKLLAELARILNELSK